MFCTQRQLDDSVKLLDAFRAKTLPPGKETDEKLWEARRIKESMLHPQTGQVLPLAFRLAAFVPVNVPICAGMLLSTPTVC